MYGKLPNYTSSHLSMSTPKVPEGTRFIGTEDGRIIDLKAVAPGKCPFPHGEAPKQPSLLEVKTAELRRFLSEQHDVCPYAGKMAREGKIHWMGLPKGTAENPRPLRMQLDRELRAFLADPQKRNMILVFEDDFQDSNRDQRCDRTHMAGKRILTELDILGTKMSHPGAPIQDIERFVGQNRMPELLDPRKHVETPAFRWRNGDPAQDSEGSIFVFMMSPVYHPEHARYAPHTCVVLTYVSDVDRVFLEETAVATRIGVNAAIGLIAQGIPEVSVAELRRGTSMEEARDAKGNLMGFSPNWHPAVSFQLQMIAAAFAGKKLFVYPPHEDLFKQR